MYDIFTVLKSIDYYNQYNSYNKVSNILGLYRQTVTNWIKTYKLNLSKLSKRIISFKNHNEVKHNFTIVNDNILKFISKIIYDNPFMTKNEVKEFTNKEFNLKLSDKKITKIFKHLNLSKKKCKKYIIKNINYIDEISKLRDDFINKIKKENIDKIISIDETGINNFLSNYITGYSPKGESISIPCDKLKFKNQSVLIALTTEKILTFDICEDSVNTDIYYNFINKIIKLLKTNNYIFIFDNVSFHHSENVLKLINDSGNKYIFIPPYSPNLNPIENVNGIIKNKIQKTRLNEINNDEIKLLTKKEKNDKINKNKIFIKNKEKEEKEENKRKYKNKEIDKKDSINKKKEIIIINKKLLKLLNDEIKNNEKEKVKKYIKKAINEINEEYNKIKITSIFNHAFNYDYKKIEQELKDRIKFIK